MSERKQLRNNRNIKLSYVTYRYSDIVYLSISVKIHPNKLEFSCNFIVSKLCSDFAARVTFCVRCLRIYKIICRVASSRID